MEVGDVIRTRRLRAYFEGKEARGYAEFSADNGARKRQDQKVFVLLLLGSEPMEATGDEVLPVELMVNSLGYWGETQLEDVLGKRAATPIIKKMRKFARAKQEKARHESTGSNSEFRTSTRTRKQRRV